MQEKKRGPNETTTKKKQTLTTITLELIIINYYC